MSAPAIVGQRFRGQRVVRHSPSILAADIGVVSSIELFVPVDPVRPMPLVLDGDVESWSVLADRELARLAALAVRQYSGATIAIVRGAASRSLQELICSFDLSAAVTRPEDSEGDFNLVGDDEAVERELARWWQGFEQSPQACTVTARLLRLEPPSLEAEAFAYSMLQAGREHAKWLDRGPKRGETPDANDDDRVSTLALGSYREIVLQRPARHNAFDTRMRDELCDVLDAVVREPGAIGLRGQGPSFCSGGDLEEFGTFADPATAFLVRTRRSVGARLGGAAGRTVAAVHGWCIGAGIELAAFAGHVVAAEGARFQLPEASFGLLPGAGGTVSLTPRIGRYRVLELVVTGRVLDSDSALAWGLVDEVVKGGELIERLREAADEFSAEIGSGSAARA